MDGVDDTIGFIARAEDAGAGPVAVHLLQQQLRSLAASFFAPTGGFAGPLLDIQRAAFRLLDGPTDLGQSRELFFVAAVASGLLANVGLDASQPGTAQVYARATLLCADRAGHLGLRSWARVQQGRIAFWNGAPGEALRYYAAAESDAARVTGTMPAKLAALQAQAHGSRGDASSAQAALVRAAEVRERVRPDDLDELGGGALTCPLATQLFLHADALSHQPGPAGADADSANPASAAEEAVRALDTPGHGGSDYGNLICARADLALARIRQRDVDGTREALAPVL